MQQITQTQDANNADVQKHNFAHMCLQLVLDRDIASSQNKWVS